VPYDEHRGMRLLTPAQRRLVIAIVEALVEHDEAILRGFGAYDNGDPYEPTQRWRLWDHVDLVRPRGDPLDWEAWADTDETSPWAVIDVQMWTVQEDGPSELDLHLEVTDEEVHYMGMWS
jgi:hypothetical protein